MNTNPYWPYWLTNTVHFVYNNKEVNMRTLDICMVFAAFVCGCVAAWVVNI